MTTRHASLTGWLFAANSETRRFSFEFKDGERIKGHYLPSAQETLDRAWDHQVTADFEIEEPEHPTLPGAPKARYTLLQVRHISPHRPSMRPLEME